MGRGSSSSVSPSPAAPAEPPAWLKLGVKIAFLSAVLALLGSLFLLAVRIVDWWLPLQEMLSISQAMVLLVFVVIALAFQGLYVVALATSLVMGRLGAKRALTPEQRRRLFMSKVLGGGFLVLVVPILVVVMSVGCAETPRLRTNFRIGVVYSKDYNISILGVEKFYPFDVHKYEKIHDELIRVGVMREEDFLIPQDVREEDLLLVHSPEYLERVRTAGGTARCLEFPAVRLLGPLARPLVLKPFEKATAGTILAARTALTKGIAFNLAGGYAHACGDQGGGFNILADVPVAIRVLQEEGLVRRALVVDCDVHQGQGTAREFADDPEVVTFDMYNRHIYPADKVPADVDLPLNPGTTGEQYLALLRKDLPRAIEMAQPDLVIYVAGSDVYCSDPLGGLDLSAQDVLKRDMFVIDSARSRGIPIAVVLSGGYSAESWKLHYDTIRETIGKYCSEVGGQPY